MDINNKHLLQCSSNLLELLLLSPVLAIRQWQVIKAMDLRLRLLSHPNSSNHHPNNNISSNRNISNTELLHHKVIHNTNFKLKERETEKESKKETRKIIMSTGTVRNRNL